MEFGFSIGTWRHGSTCSGFHMHCRASIPRLSPSHWSLAGLVPLLPFGLRLWLNATPHTRHTHCSTQKSDCSHGRGWVCYCTKQMRWLHIFRHSYKSRLGRLAFLSSHPNNLSKQICRPFSFFIKMARTSLSRSGLIVLSVLCSVVMSALVQVTDFGANPTGLQMYINVPAKLATKPAVILAVGASLQIQGQG